MFITLEGGEGAGKSTQAGLLADALRRTGREVVQTREPGGTQAAETLRAVLLSRTHDWAPLAEVMLHFAARADHVAGLIRPALARGAVVVCDRFNDSTMAYQGFGQGADREAIAALAAMVALEPDVTLVLRVSSPVAAARLRGRGLTPDRYEAREEAFHDRVRAGFDMIAAAAPGRCTVIDGDAAVTVVHAAIWSAVEGRL